MRFLCVIVLVLNFNFHAYAKGYEVLDLILENNLPFIEINVEDQKLKMLLDTGARNEVLVVEKDKITNLKNLAEFPVKFKSYDITGKMYLAKKYILPVLRIGDISFFKVRVSEDTNWGLSTGDKASIKKDGVVGLELFNDKAIIIDYPNRKFIISNGNFPDEYEIQTWRTIDYKISKEGLSIFINIDSAFPKRFILDSGSNISIIKPASIGSNQILGGCEATLTTGVACTYIKPNKFIIKEQNYPNIDFYIYNFMSLQADGILGYNFLADKAIYINFLTREIKIKQSF